MIKNKCSEQNKAIKMLHMYRHFLKTRSIWMICFPRITKTHLETALLGFSFHSFFLQFFTTG